MQTVSLLLVPGQKLPRDRNYPRRNGNYPCRDKNYAGRDEHYPYRNKDYPYRTRTFGATKQPGVGKEKDALVLV